MKRGESDLLVLSSLICLGLLFMFSSSYLRAEEAQTAKVEVDYVLISSGSGIEALSKVDHLTAGNAEGLDMIGGAEVQGGLGHFIDPTTPYRLSIALQTGLGSATRSSVFGFDTLFVKGRWKLGTNSLGKKTSLLFGAAKWEPVLPSEVYPSDYLTEDEKNAEASSENTFIAGLAFTLGDRSPTDEQWKSFEIEELSKKYMQEKVYGIDDEDKIVILKPDKKRELDNESKMKIWDDLYLPAYRSAIWQLGALFRNDNFSLDFEEAKVQAVDLYITVAEGHKWFDSAFSVHYLRNIGDGDDDKSSDSIAKWGVLGTIGAFLDLDDFPPVRTLGLTLGLGHYRYAERFPIESKSGSEKNAELTPYTKELDVMLSFAGFRNNSSAFGIRYERSWNGKKKDEEKFSLLFSTDLLSYLRDNQFQEDKEKSET